jgi:hypothetical protein
MGITTDVKLSSSCSSAKGTKEEFENSMDRAKFLIARQKYLEYLEEGQHKKALSVLRNELAASGCPRDALHNLSGWVTSTGMMTNSVSDT